MPHKLTKTQKKKIILKCHLVFFYTTMNHFSIRLWCATKSGFYTDNQLSGWSEKKLQNTSQVKLASKRGHGQCLVVCCSSDSLQLSVSWQNHYIWEVCSAIWWAAPKTAMPLAGFGQQKGPYSSPRECPTAHFTTNTSTVEQIGLWSFASSAILTWPLAKWLPLLQASLTTCCRENTSTTSRMQKMLSKSLLNPKVWF